MHFVAWKLVIEVSFGHDLCILDTIDRLIVVVVDNNDLDLEHGAVVDDTALFSDAFGSLDGDMIVLGGENVPNLLGDGYEVVVLLFLFVNDGVEVVKLI